MLLSLIVGVCLSGGCLGKPWMPPPTSTHFAPDLTGDCVVDHDDLVTLLATWGDCADLAASCGCPPENFCCRPDLDRDGIIGMSDLITILNAIKLENDL